MRQITPEQLHWLFSAQLILAVVLARHRAAPGCRRRSATGTAFLRLRWGQAIALRRHGYRSCP
jgi:hypothetical protein